MTQRNIMNERNTTNKPKGASRKSAGSAKPVSKAGSSVREVSKSSGKSSGKDSGKSTQQKSSQNKTDPKEEQNRRRQQYYSANFRQSAAYKRTRRYWWASLGVAVAGMALSWLGPVLENWGYISSGMANVITMAAMVVAFAAIGVALYIDLRKVRKLQRAEEDRIANLPRTERRELEKSIDEQIARDDALKAQKRAQRAVRKKRKKTGNDDSEN